MLAFTAPVLDWHAFAPEIVLVATLCVMLIVDVIQLDRARAVIGTIAGLGFLGALVPIITLASSDVAVRSMFGGAYVVDQTSLLLKGLFVVSAYVVVLLSTNYVADGDYWESEYYHTLVASVIGMTVITSARDMISIFVAFELLSMPTYMLASWRKRDTRSNEAGLKYFLMGVFASGLMLYGMSLLYGWGGSTLLSDLAVAFSKDSSPAVLMGSLMVIVGFGFKVSAVPFHQWAPDTYEGAPTPVTAFLAVASKTAGVVGLIQFCALLFGPVQGDLTKATTPMFLILSIASMLVGNMIALKQTNLVRMLAYSGIGQAGYILAPFAVIGSDKAADGVVPAVVTYLVIYAAMNLGAFGVVIAVARKTRSAEISSYAGLFHYAPGLTVVMTAFLFSLIGFPPAAGWYGKFAIFKVLIDADTPAGYTLAIAIVVTSTIAAYYYLNVAKTMWFDDVADGDTTPIKVVPAVGVALAIAVVITMVLGVFPSLISDAANFTPMAAAGI
ncbi:MAG TPA: NADH-quinone oxidoreductase subunit N [Microthrixaceae bacterium]|nr:NADH-quinone oxidoreductase subunit N [Microthrixaceae bacterium]